MASQSAVSVVDTTVGVAAFLDSVKDLSSGPSEPPALYVDLEGVNLCRHGSISILQIHVQPAQHTYLFDVHTLGPQTFSTPGTTAAHTLKSLFESTTPTKVFFDVRNDSDALYNLFGILVAGVDDLQLMELATRSRPRRDVTGLAKCIEYSTGTPVATIQQWKRTKDRGGKLFAPERGGSYEIFNHRPIPQDIVDYCVQDVDFLPRLWQEYHAKLKTMPAAWPARIEKATKERIALSKKPGYNGKGQHMALAPPGWPY